MADPSQQYRVPAPGLVIRDTSDGWRVVYRLEPQPGEHVLAEVSIRPLGELRPGGLPARRARELCTPGEAIKAHHEAFAAWVADWPATGRQAHLLDRLAEAYEAAGKLPKGFRAAWRARLEEQAGRQAGWHALAVPELPAGRQQRLVFTFAQYRQALDARHHAPIKRVAELQSRQVAQVRDDIHDARVEGLATPVRGRGVSGGQLTAKGQAIGREIGL